MHCAVLVFPGSNCDRDVFEAIKSISKKLPKFIWHKETNIENFDLKGNMEPLPEDLKKELDTMRFLIYGVFNYMGFLNIWDS